MAARGHEGSADFGTTATQLAAYLNPGGGLTFGADLAMPRFGGQAADIASRIPGISSIQSWMAGPHSRLGPMGQEAQVAPYVEALEGMDPTNRAAWIEYEEAIKRDLATKGTIPERIPAQARIGASLMFRSKQDMQKGKKPVLGQREDYKAPHVMAPPTVIRKTHARPEGYFSEGKLKWRMLQSAFADEPEKLKGMDKNIRVLARQHMPDYHSFLESGGKPQQWSQEWSRRSHGIADRMLARRQMRNEAKRFNFSPKLVERQLKEQVVAEMGPMPRDWASQSRWWLQYDTRTKDLLRQVATHIKQNGPNLQGALGTSQRWEHALPDNPKPKQQQIVQGQSMPPQSAISRFISTRGTSVDPSQSGHTKTNAVKQAEGEFPPLLAVGQPIPDWASGAGAGQSVPAPVAAPPPPQPGAGAEPATPPAGPPAAPTPGAGAGVPPEPAPAPPPTTPAGTPVGAGTPAQQPTAAPAEPLPGVGAGPPSPLTRFMQRRGQPVEQPPQTGAGASQRTPPQGPPQPERPGAGARVGSVADQWRLAPEQMQALEAEIGPLAQAGDYNKIDPNKLKQLLMGQLVNQLGGSPEALKEIASKVNGIKEFGMDDYLKIGRHALGDKARMGLSDEQIAAAMSTPEGQSWIAKWWEESSDLEKFAAIAGISVALIGAANIMFGEGGFGSMALTAAGLGAAAYGTGLIGGELGDTMGLNEMLGIGQFKDTPGYGPTQEGGQPEPEEAAGGPGLFEQGSQAVGGLLARITGGDAEGYAAVSEAANQLRDPNVPESTKQWVAQQSVRGLDKLQKEDPGGYASLLQWNGPAVQSIYEYAGR
jgi:hypothetical protein